ncbi:hypothetical protein BYT27DRAFT_7251932 [Phlegmacium glaucopus]|nr:hypothetical protein BYT27DRAFT_7251932 [Phlegmacium glaucopus]
MEPAAVNALQPVQAASMSPQDRIEMFLQSLPVLNKDSDVALEDSCPICLMPFTSIFAEDCSAEPETAGVTKLMDCGHMFCRRDLTNWIRSHHGSCPTCRHIFLNIRSPSESDDESSDGGEYLPNADDDFEDEDEDALDLDAFSDAEMSVEHMDLDFEAWGDEENTVLDLGDEDPGDLGDAEMDDIEQDDSSEWGLTDGESETMSSESDHDVTGEDEESVRALVTLSVSIHEDEDANDVDGESLNLTDNRLASEEPK